jgi:sirohydrochlorin cobaltochelatase
MTKDGILLFAHGARDPAWAQPFEAAARDLRARFGSQGAEVALAFLEFMNPNLLQAGEQLATEGCTRVTVVPLFLGAGGHVRKDLPRLMDELAQLHPQVQWRLSAAVGETDILIKALSDAAWSLAHQE